MDRHALAFADEHPDMRIVIFNPSMILGPMFHPEMHGSLAFFRAVLNGEKLDEIPYDTMSFIDVRDLAELELAALENKNARGSTFSNALCEFQHFSAKAYRNLIQTAW